jgi:succinate-acetate transporter protein
MCLQAVAVLAACAGVYFAELVPQSTAPLLIGILLACSLPQIICSIICLRRGEILVASISGVFGTVITLGVAFTLYQLAIQAPVPGAFTPEVLGAFWITLCVITEVFAIGFGRASWFVLAAVAEAGVAMLFLGILELGGAAITGTIAGYLLIVFAACCLYGSTAILWGEHFQRPMLPLGKPILK